MGKLEQQALKNTPVKPYVWWSLLMTFLWCGQKEKIILKPSYII